MSRIITYGTFDLFHIGHLKLLSRCKALGTSLYVGVSTDEFNSIKGKVCAVKYEDRAEIVQCCKYVDYVFPEISWDQKYNDIIKYGISTIVMGDDWTGKFDHLETLCNVIYLPRTPNVSTTDIKDFVSKIKSERKLGIYSALDNIRQLIDEA